MSIEIKGHITDGFQAVAEAFQENFEQTDELGAGFALVRGGEVLVDIRAGWADRNKSREWAEDTIVPVFSTGKAVTALVMAWLVDRGRIAYDTRIAEVWEDFGRHGKDQVTLAQALSHQSGVPGITTEMDAADWFDRETMEARVAGQEPLWEPGEGSGYHPITFGVIADAVARRVDEKSRTVGEILKQVIAGPRGIDFLIGVPQSEQARAAEHVLPNKPPHLGPINEAKKAAFLKPWSSPGRRGTATWRSAELPAANGHGTAGAIARLMSPFASEGQLMGEDFISAGTIARALEEQTSGEDRVLPFDLAYGCGVMINRDSGHYGPEPKAVGHYGFGGSCAFADPVRGVSGSYVMNRQREVLVGDERAMRLIEAAYACL